MGQPAPKERSVKTLHRAKPNAVQERLDEAPRRSSLITRFASMETALNLR